MRRVAVVYRFEQKAAPYLDALRDSGAEPVSVTPDGPIESLDGFHGLLLTGGTDVDPAIYGQDRGEHTEVPDRERDQLDGRLLRDALERDLPVLAICRGMQVFNVVHGGSLRQHIEGHTVRTEDRGLPAHSVSVVSGTRLAGIVRTDCVQVNSRHHQAVDRVGEGLVVSAVSSIDGVIEGLERPDKRFALAVQWHPEDQIDTSAEQRELFRGLVKVL